MHEVSQAYHSSGGWCCPAKHLAFPPTNISVAPRASIQLILTL